jgi:hypothetical protein
LVPKVGKLAKLRSVGPAWLDKERWGSREHRKAKEH